MLGVESGAELAGVLQGESSALDAVAETSVEGLSVLGGGGSAPPSYNLFGTPRLREVMAELREAYDRIIIHTPSLSKSAAALDLAANSDAALWLVGTGRTSEAQLAEGSRKLSLAGASMVGSVLLRS